MSDSANKAVFLSYASQDADAAKRIAEALRTVGVEVWFDQSELVGGDAWDQKIRKQIRDCALFVPILSQTTQSRREAYFRLEWRLADERTHLMAKGTPFLLPVTIDETSDRDALVPDAFLAVHWTKLPLRQAQGPQPADAALTAFGARVKRLLGGGGEAGRGSDKGDSLGGLALPLHPVAGSGDPALQTRSPRWMRPVLASAVIVLAVLAITLFIRRGPEKPPVPATVAPAAASPANAPTLSEARQLVAKAWEILDKPDFSRPAFDAADALCKRAAELDPTDADVWAVWAHVHTWFIFLSFDSSALRREAARECTSRAMQFDAKSFEARLAQAFYWVRGENVLASSAKGIEAERMLRELLREKPEDPHALLTLGILLQSKKPAIEGMQLLEQLAKNPAFAALAYNEIGWYRLLGEGGWERAGAAADRSIRIQAMWPNLTLKMLVAQHWQGDLQLAKAILDRLPPSALQDDVSATNAFQFYQRRREPQNSLSLLNEVPREWLRSLPYEGPKAFLMGLARLMAQQTESAERDFRRALELIEKHLAEDSNNSHLLRLKAEVLHYLNQGAEAEKAYRLVRELNATEATQFEAEMNLTLVDNDVRLRILFETPDAVIDDLESRYERNWSMTAAVLRFDPVFDPLRGNPRFTALLARAEADPRKSPAAKEAPPVAAATSTPGQ